MASILYPTRWGVVLMLASKYELDTTTLSCNFHLYTLRYVVTLTFDLLTLESCHLMPLGWSIPVPSLNRIRPTVPELGRLQFFIDRQLKVPVITFLGVKGVKFQISSFLTRTMYRPNDVLCTGMCLGMRPVAPRWRSKQKRIETFMRQTGYLPRPPTRHSPPPEIVHAVSCLVK